MIVAGVVLLELLEVLELAFEVAHLAFIALSFSRKDFSLILGDVLVDGFHRAINQFTFKAIHPGKGLVTLAAISTHRGARHHI